MKGIYKKISVGVLAAALLVGGSGLVQGGQAFANKRIELDKEHQNKREEVVSYVYGWLSWVKREDREDQLEKEKISNLNFLKRYEKDFGYQVEVSKKRSNAEAYYKNVHGFINSLLNHEDKKEVLEGEYNVQIGLDVFKFVFKK